MSITWRIFLIYFFILVLALSGMGIYLYNDITNDFISAEEVSNLTQANIISNIVAGSIGKDSYKIRPSISNFTQQVNSRILLFNKEGYVIVDSSNIKSFEGHKPSVAEVKSALKGKSMANVYYLNGSYVMYTAVPVVKEGRNVGALLLSTPIDDVAVMAEKTGRGIIYLFSAVGILISIISLLVARFISKPIKKLTVAAQEMSKGHLGYVVDIKSNDEIGRLASAFNDMSIKLKDIDESRKKFVSDASHELKTPIAAVKALVEPLLMGNPDIEVYKEFLADINSELDRMGRLVNQLLELTRLEKAVSIKKEELNINKVIKSVVDDLRPIAEKKDIDISYSLTDPVIIYGNEDLIYRLIYNLVENGIKYSPMGHGIEIYSQYKEHKPVLIVRDNGYGIEKNDLPHIFERFTRSDKVRNRKSGGVGLGLAIVKEIADLHEAEIHVESEINKGTKFVIEF